MRWIRRAVMGKVAHWGWRNRSRIKQKAKSLFGGSGAGAKGRATSSRT